MLEFAGFHVRLRRTFLTQVSGFAEGSNLGIRARAGVALTFVTEPGAGTEVVASWSP